MNILSLDANSKSIGYCLSTVDKYVKSGQYSTKGNNAFERVHDYMIWLYGIIRVENVGLVVYEKPSGNRGNMDTNLVLGGVRQCTWNVCNSYSIPMAEISPKTVKATGIYKDQLHSVLQYKVFTYPTKADGTINKAALSRINDEIDAIGIMVAYLKKQGKELEPC